MGMVLSPLEVVKYVNYVAKHEGWKIEITEDFLHDVIVRVMEKMKKFEAGRGRESTFLYYVIRSAIVNYMKSRNRWERIVEFDFDECWYWGGDGFYERYLRVIRDFEGRIGRDLMRILIGEIEEKEYSNLLKSASLSREKGVRLLERWLGRKLTVSEKECLRCLRDIL